MSSFPVAIVRALKGINAIPIPALIPPPTTSAWWKTRSSRTDSTFRPLGTSAGGYRTILFNYYHRKITMEIELWQRLPETGNLGITAQISTARGLRYGN